MPSGSKKRKAAKKKKEQEANINSSTNNTNKSNNNNNSNTPLGNDDPKSQDERESDRGDAGEPASQDHHNQQHLFNEANKESEKREVPRDVKETANEGAEGNGAAKIQREMKSKDDLGGQNISIKHVEYVKESDDGSSSSSSSDNESQAVEKPSEKAIQGTEEKASSGKGDASEAASQDHHNQQHLFNEGNKESEKRKVPRDVKDTANEGAEGNGAAKIQMEMKYKDDLGGQNISIKHVEYVKESDDGSSSSSSSDNESQAVEKPSEKAIEGTEEKASSGKGDASEAASQDHHNQQHLFNEGNKESEKRDVPRDVKDTANEGAEGNDAAKIQMEMKSKDDLGGQNISIKHVEYVKESDDGSSSSSSSDNESQAVEKPSGKAIQGTEEKASSGKVADDLVVGNAPAVVAPDLVESRLKENEELKRNEDEDIPLSEESIEASWTLVEPVTDENEGKNLPLPAAPESSNGAKHTGDSKSTVSSDRQPLLASAPRVEQRTSCMSCCGLFDVLIGSGR